jgi:uncharacterized protein YndB with AHSA1/START domain
MSEPTARVSKMITASPEEIWAALTTPRIMKSYFLGADVSSDFQVGSPITFRGQFKGKSYEDHGAIQTADPQRRLAFTHFSPLGGLPDQPENYHTVTFDLAAVKGGTQVTLTQANLLGGPKAVRRRASRRVREELDDRARRAEEDGREALTGHAVPPRPGGVTARHRPEAAGSRARPARPARRGAGWTTGCRSSAGSGPRRP